MKHKALIFPILFSLACSGCFDGLLGGKAIKTKEELMELITNIKASGEYQLKNDIDLGGEIINQPDDTNGSAIVIRGNGHKISNATIMSSYNASLFGNIGSGTLFQDIVFDNITAIGKNPAIIASKSEGGEYKNITINDTCKIGDGTSDNAAGLVATSKVDHFNNCVNYSNVIGLSYVGGIVGNSLSEISECKNYGAITGYGETNIGGIAGKAAVNPSSYKINGNVNYGEVTSQTAQRVGGVAGSFENEHGAENVEAVFDGNINYGNIKGKNSVGGVAGAAIPHRFSSLIENYGNRILITNSTNSGTVIGQKGVGGIVGQSFGDLSQAKAKSYSVTYSFCSNLLNSEGSNYIQGEYHIGGISGNGNLFKNCNNAVPLKMVESSDTSLIDKEKPEKYYQFGMGGISGLTNINFTSEFSACSNTGSIRGYDSTIRSDTIIATSIGGIVGICYGGSFVLCNSSGKLSGYSSVGGIIGSLIPNFTSSMSTPSFSGTLDVFDAAGGLIGYSATNPDAKANTTISNASVRMEGVKVRMNYVGGYIGYTNGYAETNNSYYEKISIINSSSSYTYYYSENSITSYITPDVGLNAMSLENKKMVSLDDTSRQNASNTSLGLYSI